MCKPFRQFPDVSLGIIGAGLVVSGHNLVPNRICVLVVHIVRKVVEMEEPIHEVATDPQFAKGYQWVACAGQLWEYGRVRLTGIRRWYVDKLTSSFKTVQGIQRFLVTRDVASVDHPGFALPDSARQFLMHTKVERAVRNQVWHHEHPWMERDIGRGGGNFWRSDGDERHYSRVDDCRRVESEA